MITRTFQDLQLSGLGLGCMRLPLVAGSDAQPDADRVQEMVDLAIQKGINYFDTAWGYHEGASEIVIGQALKKHERSTFYLADKFPGYDLNNMPKVEEIFEEQLKKCQVDYFDFYLFHNVCEKNIDAYLDPQYHIYEYLMEQKKKGRIRHLGFSCHGDLPVLKRFLEAYGESMEFCQIQLNYLDWEFQSAKEKCEILKTYGIPVWVMEPLRGGKLAQIDPEFEPDLQGKDPIEWAFRFTQSIPEVTMVLSGMSDMDQLQENIRIWESDKPLTSSEMDTLLMTARKMTAKTGVPCTACHYCTSHCPQQLDIPRLISLYNEFCFSNGGFIAPMVIGTLPKEQGPSACIQCRSCEKVCPQQIKISEVFQDFVKRLG